MKNFFCNFILAVVWSNMGANGSPAVDGRASPSPPSTPPQVQPVSPALPPPNPGTLQRPTSIDPPMKLPEVQAAAEHALLTSITDESLRKALSSAEGFEVQSCTLSPPSGCELHSGVYTWC